MRHFIDTQDWTVEQLQSLIDGGKAFKGGAQSLPLAGKSIALLFFNPSLRTRTSFELGASQLGGQAIVLQPGKDAWPLSFEMGAVMDGDAEEHVCEAAGVLSRYCDLIAVRCFPKFQNWEQEREDHMIKSFAQHATVPIVNMETIVHPCQELAHIMALQERLGDLKGKRYLLTWTWHPKPLNTAVANSAATIATRFGMDVTLLCPNEQYLLDERYLQRAKDNASVSGGSFSISHDKAAAYEGADIVYAKSWGAIGMIGDVATEAQLREPHRDFIVDEAKMARTNGAVFSHCLPMRRNVKATDGVVDSPASLVLDEAENRLHVQKAIMSSLSSQSTPSSQTEVKKDGTTHVYA